MLCLARAGPGKKLSQDYLTIIDLAAAAVAVVYFVRYQRRI